MRILVAVVITTIVVAQDLPTRGWIKGKGYGTVYGKDDQIGALNAITDPAHVSGAERCEDRSYLRSRCSSGPYFF